MKILLGAIVPLVLLLILGVVSINSINNITETNKRVENTFKGWQSNVTESNIQLRRLVGDSETMNDMAKLVGEARGKVYFDKFRSQIETFIKRESTLLEKRRDEFKQAEKLVGSSFKTLEQSTVSVDHTHNVLEQAKQVSDKGG